MMKRKLIKALAALALLSPLSAFAQLPGTQVDLLPEEEAFQVVAQTALPDSLVVSWRIAPDYYMYQDKFAVLSLTDGVRLGEPVYPAGIVEEDELFGRVEVFFDDVQIVVPIVALPEGVEKIDLELHGQGCNKPVGVCYPPQKRPYILDVTGVLPGGAPTAGSSFSGAAMDVGADAGTAGTDGGAISLWGYVITAFWAGVLLTFTPCVLPLIPILSGIIAGQGDISKIRGGILAVAYVLGTSATYTATGIVAGATGAQLQAYFQSPLAIGIISIILVALAFSLFGAYQIQMPSVIQSRIQSRTQGLGSGSLSMVFVLGALSALIVGACVSPLLIVALGAAIQQGDPVLGGAMMFSMSMGMGILLIAFGFGAGWLIPKAGAWMERVTQLFGFMLLGVVIYLLGNANLFPTIILWAVWLVVLGCFALVLADEFSNNALWRSFLKGFGIVLIVWGAASTVGALTGARDVLSPLDAVIRSAARGVGPVTSAEELFVSVKNNQELDQQLAGARQAGRPVMIDFYADWCPDCIRMLRTTFLDSGVQAALEDWVMIKVDVTNPGSTADEIKTRYSVFGPPATLYIDAAGNEMASMRRYGYMKPAVLLEHIAPLLSSSGGGQKG
jgi:thiol:disulfide interchange protein DsbD